MYFRSPSLIGLLTLCLAVPICAQAALPPCAAACFSSALSNQTICQPMDTQCICGSESLKFALQGCVLGSCTLKESLFTVNATNSMCGVPTKDRSTSLIVTNAISGSLALAALGIRLLVSIQQNIFGLDDASAIIAYIFAAPITFGQIACGILGFGRDTWAVAADSIYVIMKVVYFNQICYFISTGFCKLCFLLMFLRIFPDQRTRRLSCAGIAFTLIFVLAFGLPLTFGCKPISAMWTSWDMETPYDYCINQYVFWFIAAGFNIAIDIYIVLIPIPELMKLNLSLRKKLMLVAIFSTGVITILVSIIRLWSLAQYGGSTNPMYDNVLSAIMSPLELNVGIICMCMPAFRRFMARFLPSCFGSTFGSSNQKCRESDESEPIPNVRLSSGPKGPGRRRPNTLGRSLFETTITKTIDTKVEESTVKDDEVGLVELGKHGEGASVDAGSERAPESLYKAKHQGTLPKEW